MRIADIHTDGNELWMRLFGDWGYGQANLESGRYLQRTLEEHLGNAPASITDVVLDFTSVYGIGADGPLWSVGPAIRDSLVIRFVAAGDTYNRLRGLLAAVNLNQLIRLELGAGKFSLLLCANCLSHYRALRYDPDASYRLCVVPFGSLAWDDEHPDGWTRVCCRECRMSITHLVDARTKLWTEGEIPEVYQGLWEHSRGLLPDWPGFQRLSLTEVQRSSLNGCFQELDECHEYIHERYDRVEVQQQQAGLHSSTGIRKDAAPTRVRWWSPRRWFTASSSKESPPLRQEEL